MIKHNQPIKFIPSGNIPKAQTLTWKAREFMGKLYQMMKFQNLKVLQHRFEDADGTIYFCTSNQNGLVPIDSVEIVAFGGGAMDILEGFIVRLTTNRLMPNGVDTNNFLLHVEWVESDSREDDYLNRASNIRFDSLQNYETYEGIEDELIPLPANDNGYVIYPFGSVPYVYTARTPYSETASTARIDCNGTYDLTSILADYHTFTEDQYSAVTRITQSINNPRVRLFGWDYEITGDGAIKIKKWWSPAFDSDADQANSEKAYACAVLKKSADFVSDFSVTGDFTVYDSYFSCSYIANNIYGMGLTGEQIGHPVNSNEFFGPMYQSEVVKALSAGSKWHTENEVNGKYEIRVESRYPGIEFELDFLLFGSAFKKARFSGKTGTTVNTGRDYNYQSEKKLIVSVGKEEIYTPEFNPHIMIKENK